MQKRNSISSLPLFDINTQLKKLCIHSKRSRFHFRSNIIPPLDILLFRDNVYPRRLMYFCFIVYFLFIFSLANYLTNVVLIYFIEGLKGTQFPLLSRSKFFDAVWRKKMSDSRLASCRLGNSGSTTAIPKSRLTMGFEVEVPEKISAQWLTDWLVV